MVRALAVRLLERLGYKVLAFASGSETLQALAQHRIAIDLLITDLVMPGMNGRMLADQIRQHYPRLQVLFTSGYSEQLIEHHGILEHGVEFLAKPYTVRALADRVRSLLDKPR